MNKTAACIKIIQLLSCRELMNTKEIADTIETNPRNVREYIKELEACGYTIESVQGVKGGYKLTKGDVLPTVNLDVSEIDSLRRLLPYLKGKEYDDYQKIEDSLGKLLSSGANKDNISPMTMNERFPLSMDKGELQKRFTMLSDAIDTQTKCEVKYISSQNKESDFVLHPYKLFVYNGSWFVLAWNEKVSDFGYYKFNRIADIIKTKNHFSIMKAYNEADYLDEFGMKKNGEFYHIELKLTNLNVVAKERIYGKNQVVTELDANHAILSCDMQNKEMIKSFVLSLGANATVLEPEWLKDEVKSEVWKVMECYE